MKRGAKLHLSSDTIEGDLVIGQQAIEEGLVDEIGIFKDVVEKEFPGSVVHDLVLRDNHPGANLLGNVAYAGITGQLSSYFKKMLRAFQGQL